MAKNQHLTLADRLEIEARLAQGCSLRSTAKALGKSPSTITNEIRSRSVSRFVKVNQRIPNSCKERKSCLHKDLCLDCRYVRPRLCSTCSRCNDVCLDYTEELCLRLEQTPYVCNPCPQQHHCTLRRRVYEAKAAQEEYQQNWSQDRSGYCLTGEEMAYIDELILPRLRQGHSLYAITQDYKDRLPCGISTLYRLINDGELTARNIDLPRKVRFRPGRPKRPHKVDKACRQGRTWQDYHAFLEAEEPPFVVQMDTVEGQRGGPVVLSLGWVNHHLIRLHKRQHNDARSVAEVMDKYEEQLGLSAFRELFPVILTDNGSECSDPQALEFSPFTGERRTWVFYCDPMRSDQKGALEALHRDVRRILPKGQPIDPWTQEKLEEACDHLNSYPRKALKDTSPYVSFAFYMGEEFFRRLGWQCLPLSAVCLTPSLLPVVR